MHEPLVDKSYIMTQSKQWSKYSLKLHRDVTFTSELEYHNWLIVECNPYVKQFVEHPFQIQLVNCNIHFDMWIQYLDGVEEFRQIRDLEQFLNITSYSFYGINAAEEWCKANDYAYSLITQTGKFNNRVYLENLEDIVSCINDLKENLDLNRELTILELVEFNPCSLKNLCRTLKQKRVDVLNVIYWMLYTGIVRTDLISRRFNDHSIISIRKL